MKNKIHPETLKRSRERARLSQEALAEKSRIGKKTISRIENGKGGNIRAHTIKSLSAALQIKPDDLAKAPEEITSENPANRMFKAYVDTDVALAYALVEHRYKVQYQSLVEMAPLFFTLMAEGSLAWRREKQVQMEEAAGLLGEWAISGGHPSYAVASFKVEEDGLPEEEDSINSCDLFGEEFGERADELDYDPYRRNPFSEYLKKLVADIGHGNPGYEDILELQSIDDRDDFFDRAVGKMPGYRICKPEVEKITKGNPKAKHALAYSHVKISDIPEELQEDEASEKRVQWIIERIPQDELEQLEEQERFWEQLLSLGKPSL